MKARGRHPALLVICAAIVTTLLAGCSTPRPDGTAAPALRGQWQLSEASDPDGPLELAGQRITLTVGSDATASGRNSCGTYSAKVFGVPTALWITTAVPRREHCLNEARARLDRRFLVDLGTVRVAQVTGGLMDLSSATGVTLHFERAIAQPLTHAFGREWRLETVESNIDNFGDGRFRPGLYDVRMRMTPYGRVTGSTGCRTFDARWVQDAGETLVINFVFTASASCDGPTASIESQFLSVLSSGFVLAPGGNALILDSTRAGLSLAFDGVGSG